MPTRSDSIRWAVATATSRDSAVLASVTARLGEPGSSTNEVAARLAESRAAASLSTAGPRSVSLAHHGGRAIAAAALHPTRIGVDLERDGEILFAHARYFLNTREQKELGRLSLTELWALKEAAWKALGLDDTVALTDLELLFDGDDALPYAVRLGSMIRAIGAELRAPWQGWVAAIVLLAGTAA